MKNENNRQNQLLGLALILPFFLITLLVLVSLLTVWINIITFFYIITLILLGTIIMGMFFSINSLIKNKKLNLRIGSEIFMGIISFMFFFNSFLEVNSYTAQMQTMFSPFTQINTGNIDSFSKEDEAPKELKNIDWEAEMNDAMNDSHDDIHDEESH
jgi:hypothetical protein